MFTGIIEATGVITDIETNGTNKTFWISSPVSQELKIDQSVAHNGVCLTVEEVKDGLTGLQQLPKPWKRPILANGNKE